MPARRRNFENLKISSCFEKHLLTKIQFCRGETPVLWRIPMYAEVSYFHLRGAPVPKEVNFLGYKKRSQ